jgi:hypothetical protein
MTRRAKQGHTNARTLCTVCEERYTRTSNLCKRCYGHRGYHFARMKLLGIVHWARYEQGVELATRRIAAMPLSTSAMRVRKRARAQHD